ncbi:RNA-directed DNA polymerase [Marinilabiliaceae bacterium JC040]|nr:RNA-directed DNA polymerase [Marinilabiliaceae bacterium JC040]
MSANFDIYKKEFEKKASNNGYSAENIQKCLLYAEPLIENNLPVIYNTSHFSRLVEYQKSYINRAVQFPKSFYRHFKILKKNGNTRLLSEPLPSLKEIQNWILEEILYKVKVSRYAKAYVKNRSIKDHIKYHKKSEKILTLDITKFFDSIEFELIENFFKNLGYSNLISNLLTKLCYLDESLPQGAPTSPCLSNIIMYDFDEVMGGYCRKKNLKFSRYADDMAFSGNFNKEELIDKVRFELSKIGLKLNNDKTKLMTPNMQQIITGVVVNEKAQIPKSERNKIRNAMFYIKRDGLLSHMEVTKQDKANYLEHLLGRIKYVLFLNDKDKEFMEYKKFLYDLQNK